MESINLSTPYQVDPRQTSTFKVDSLLLNWRDKRIEIHLGDGTIQRLVTYNGDQATTLMTALNKANLSTNSLHKRIINQLITDGYLAGTITGTVD